MDMKVLKEINRKAASRVATAATSTTPVGGPYKAAGRGRPRSGGRLKASIRPGATTKAGVVKAGSSRVPYAGPIHWGWPRRNIKAQPFLTTAAKATEPVWMAEYKRHMEEAIDQVKGK